MSELLEKYDWRSDRYERTRMPGTEDWVEVARLADSGGGYEWTQFNVFYSPSARRFFWHGDSGCSCNSWEDGVSSAESFENGDREALVRAWERFTEGHWLKDSERDQGLKQIREISV